MECCLKINVIRGFREERIKCLLYGRMIMILLLGMINSITMKYAYSIGREISEIKLINYLIADHYFSKIIFTMDIETLIKDLIIDIPRKLCKDKRKRKTLRQRVRDGDMYHTPHINNLHDLA